MTALLRQGLRAILSPFLFLLLMAYFLWNTLHGEHGLKAYQDRVKIKEEAVLALNNARQEQDIWRRRVNALNERSLDIDMLDERSRAMLNASKESEIVVPYGEQNPLY